MSDSLYLTNTVVANAVAVRQVATANVTTNTVVRQVANIDVTDCSEITTIERIASIANYTCGICHGTGIEERKCQFAVLKLPCDICTSFDRNLTKQLVDYKTSPDQQRQRAEKSKNFLGACVLSMQYEHDDSDDDGTNPKDDRRKTFLPHLLDMQYIDYDFGGRVKKCNDFNNITTTQLTDSEQFGLLVDAARESVLNSQLLIRIVYHRYFRTLSNTTLRQIRKKLRDLDMTRDHYSKEVMQRSRRWLLLQLKSLDVKNFIPYANQECDLLRNMIGHDQFDSLAEIQSAPDSSHNIGLESMCARVIKQLAVDNPSHSRTIVFEMIV